MTAGLRSRASSPMQNWKPFPAAGQVRVGRRGAAASSGEGPPQSLPDTDLACLSTESQVVGGGAQSLTSEWASSQSRSEPPF